MKQVFFFGVLFLFSYSFASNYPGDYAIKSSCQTLGPVKICRSLQANYNQTALDVSYTGSLASSPAVKMWIRVNYQDGSVNTTATPLVQTGSAEFRVTGGCLIGVLGGCKTYGTQDMRELLTWSQQMDGKLNALDLDIAFTDGNSWDNNGVDFGTYHFSFSGE